MAANLRLVSGANTTASGSGVNLPLGFGFFGPGRDGEAEVRAMAAAAALAAPAIAQEISRIAIERPGQLAEPASMAELMQETFSAIAQARTERKIDPPPSSLQITVARAVNADPILASAAHRLINTDEKKQAASIWVALCDPARLAQAAKVARRAMQLELLPKPAEPQAIEARVVALEQYKTVDEAATDDLKQRVDKLEQKTAGKRPSPAGGEA